jgi:hypothetical protein
LHILYSGYCNSLYNMTNCLDKYEWFYSMLGNPMASFGTISADVHRVRRSALGRLFSTQAVVKFYPHTQPIIDRLIARIELCAERDEEIPLFYAYRCPSTSSLSMSLPTKWACYTVRTGVSASILHGEACWSFANFRLWTPPCRRQDGRPN